MIPAALFLLAAWLPPDVRTDVRPQSAVLARLVSLNAAAAANRRESWTYRFGDQNVRVQVAVRGGDHRAMLTLDGLDYGSGRLDGRNWRMDGNGVVHDVYSDLQGDPFDRLPDAVFPLDVRTLHDAGTSTDGHAVVRVDAPRDRPHWLYLDDAGHVVREVTREGRLTITYAFHNAALNGWSVSDGNPADAFDAVRMRIMAAHVDPQSVAIPSQRRLFVSPPGDRMQTLATQFVPGGDIIVETKVDDHIEPFLIDTGTEDITVDDAYARQWGLLPLLGHLKIASLRVGDGVLEDASVSTFPLNGTPVHGILGYDWFFGHIVHISYHDKLVQIGSDAAAASVFADPATAVVPIDTHESIPLAPASIGGETGTRFALDTGSPQLEIFDAFVQQKSTLPRAWEPARFADGAVQETVSYLEGDVDAVARRIPRMTFGPLSFDNLIAGVAQPDSQLVVPIDGIIGTEILAKYDLWFDYDHQRLGLRAVQ